MAAISRAEMSDFLCREQKGVFSVENFGPFIRDLAAGTEESSPK
jgi:hypothetical protein